VTFIDTATSTAAATTSDSLPSCSRPPGRGHAGDEIGIAGNHGRPRRGRLPVRGDAAYVRQCIDESLARLQTDVVDLLLHATGVT